MTPVYCYTNYPSAELFVNGKSQGRIIKNPDTRLDRYRLRWNDVVYEPGELKVVAYDNDGKAVATKTVRTASAPVALIAEADRTVIKADGNDLAFITVSTQDKNGTFCPTIDDNITFSVSGAATFRATCNGDATSLQPFTKPEMKLFSGQLVVVVQSNGKKGKATLTITDSKRGLTKTVDIVAK